MRIEHREVHRPEHLPDVKDIADYRVVDAFQYWQFLGQADCTSLSEKLGDTRNSRKHDQWNFFQHSLPDLPLDSIERPVVEKQEHEWQCYQHRFRHQTTDEDEYHDEVAPNLREAHVIKIGTQCEHEKTAPQ